MDKDQFWEIIGEARAEKDGILNAGILRMQKRIRTLDLEGVLKFQHYFDGYKRMANRSLITGLACLLAGCEKDEYVDLIDFYLEQLIVYGKNFYTRVLSDPDSIVGFLESPEADEYDAKLLNEMVPQVVAEMAPDLDYYRLYAAVRLTEEEKRQMRGEIPFSPQLDVKWENLSDLEPLLPGVFAFLQREEEDDDY